MPIWTTILAAALSLQATASPQTPPVTGGPAPADGPGAYVDRKGPATTARTDARFCNPPDMKRGTSYGTHWDVAHRYKAEMWYSKNNEGNSCLQTMGDHGFQIDWDIQRYGFLHEVGQYDFSIPPATLADDLKATFDIGRAEFGGSGGYTGLYGWFGKAGDGNTVEFYINETWGGLPIDMSDCVKKGTITVDGGTYDIYMRPRQGRKGEQWWSNRQTPRTRGTISYARHIAEWRKLGMTDYPLTRVSFSLEAHWGSPTNGVVRYDAYTIDRPRARRG